MNIFSLGRNKNPEGLAKILTEKIAQSTFAFFKQNNFREEVKFNQIAQVEQDRIFNELIATGICLAILMSGTMLNLAQKKKNNSIVNFYQELVVELYSRYGNWLRELGTEEKFATMWKGLIEMRVKEYQKDFREHKKEFPSELKANPWISVCSIGCLYHIRRGKPKDKDDLFILIIRWAKSLAIEISKLTLKSLFSTD